jgi:hypothetical protein
MRPCALFAAILALGAALSLPFVAEGQEEAKPPVIKATSGLELADPAGDVERIHSSSGDYPGLDVIKLTLASDGKQLKITTVLKDPPGVFADTVVELYFDTDRNAKTGAALTFPPIAGLEFLAKLQACIDFDDKSAACVGGSSKGKPVRHWAGIDLEHYQGKGQYDRKSVIDAMGFPGSKASVQTPISGTTVAGVIDYADLGVKPGQTIRILAREASGKTNADSFPEIWLTLK